MTTNNNNNKREETMATITRLLAGVEVPVTYPSEVPVTYLSINRSELLRWAVAGVSEAYNERADFVRRRGKRAHPADVRERDSLREILHELVEAQNRALEGGTIRTSEFLT